eukprot:scaffold1168_cov167-Amphora_coffeaeformis.AAC.47
MIFDPPGNSTTTATTFSGTWKGDERVGLAKTKNSAREGLEDNVVVKEAVNECGRFSRESSAGSRVSACSRFRYRRGKT